MKKVLANFGHDVLSRGDMKSIKGGVKPLSDDDEGQACYRCYDDTGFLCSKSLNDGCSCNVEGLSHDCTTD